MYISEAGQLQLNRLHNCSRLSRGCLEQGVQADLLLGKPEGGLAKAAGGAQQQHAQQLQQGLAELKLQADLLMAELKEAWQRQLGKGSSRPSTACTLSICRRLSSGGRLSWSCKPNKIWRHCRDGKVLSRQRDFSWGIPMDLQKWQQHP